VKSAKAQSSHYHPPHHTHTPKTALSRTRTFLLWWRKWSRRWRSTCGSSFLRPQTRNREESGEGEGACIVATTFFGAEYMCSLRVKAKAEDRTRWTTSQPHIRRNKGTDVTRQIKNPVRTRKKNNKDHTHMPSRILSHKLARRFLCFPIFPIIQKSTARPLKERGSPAGSHSFI